MGMYGGGGNPAKDARAAEAARQRRIDQGMREIDAKFSEFAPDFYKRREQAYLGTVTPELNVQLDKTRKTLAYQLARSGLGTSSAGIELNSSLDREAGNKEREIADAAIASGNQTRNDVENQRSALVNQLNASGNPASINQSLIASTANLRAPSPVGNIGNFFGDWANIYMANQQARASDSTVQPIFSFGGDNRSSRSVT